MEEAFQRYNMSVLRARSNDNSEENTLALSLANRSACLFHMGEYEATASDVHSAIADGYPEDQRHKLYLRLAKSYLKLGLSAKARDAIQCCHEISWHCGHKVLWHSLRIEV